MEGRIIHGGTELSGQGQLSAGGHIVVSGTVTPHAKPRTTSMGLQVKKTFEIHESEDIGSNVRQYELRIDGEVTWSGMGDDRVDALLNAIMAATDESDGPPDN